MSRLNYYTPAELMSKARDVMIPLENQLPAQQKIATIIGMHLARIQALNRGASPNEIVNVSAFLVGATGSGKSYIIKSLAEICGLHFRQIDMATLTQSGVKGRNLAHVMDEIVSEDKTFFEDGGILNLDEADKTFYVNDPHYDAYSVQQDLLKLMEGGDYTYTVDGRTKTVNLDRTLILLSGACAKITKILKRKHCERGTIGFTNGGKVQTKIEDYASMITLDDLIAGGLMGEMASRVNTLIHISKIDMNGYRMLLTANAKSSAINRFKNQFAMRGVQFDVSAEAVEAIAAESVKRDVGARSVQAILNENLMDAYRIADDTPDYNAVRLYVNGEGHLDVEYRSGTRIPVPVFRKMSESPDFNLYSECASSESIDQFADDITQRAILTDVADERLVYYFLQTACRFLGNEVRPSERTFVSVLKLADATECQPSDDSYKSPYDIICGDYIDKLAKEMECRDDRAVQHTVFCHYYNAFKTENRKRSHTHRILTEALKSAGDSYCPVEHRPVRTRTR